MRGLWRVERELRAEGISPIAGVDEAGRGPLAGPVVAAAVILPPRCRLPGLNDSKALTVPARERLFDLIQDKALSIGVAVMDAKTVDRINVLRATHRAMREAILKLEPIPALDRIMEDLHARYPEYGFDRHKGYATPGHLECLSALGPCPAHRMTFAPVRSLLQQRLGLDWSGVNTERGAGTS